ncbi:uncharacterized protein IWZ02DRAFT_46083 [Phyllosticta citriasiana]|uniref:uncharacterized protein n=1 Tax=Phyllosticta citriasiana TaxID=595635 RepID=UPI0030FDE3C5
MRSCGLGGASLYPTSTRCEDTGRKRTAFTNKLAGEPSRGSERGWRELGGCRPGRAGGRRLAARGKRYLTCGCPRGGWKRVACGVEEGRRRRRRRRRRRSFFAPLPVPVDLSIAHLTERAFDHLEAVPLCPTLFFSPSVHHEAAVSLYCEPRMSCPAESTTGHERARTTELTRRPASQQASKPNTCSTSSSESNPDDNASSR